MICMIFSAAGKPESVRESELTPDVTALIVESAMLETLSVEDLDVFMESVDEQQNAQQEEVLVERSIVRLDKQAKLTQAQKTAVFTIAKEKNDPMMKKLITVWRIERALEEKLLRKYGNEGMRRARAAMDKAGNSKSSVVKKAADNVKKQFNTPRGKVNANTAIPHI